MCQELVTMAEVINVLTTAVLALARKGLVGGVDVIAHGGKETQNAHVHFILSEKMFICPYCFNFNLTKRQQMDIRKKKSSILIIALLIFLLLLLYKLSPWGIKVGAEIEYYSVLDKLSVISNSKTPFLMMPKAPIFNHDDSELFIVDMGNSRVVKLNKKFSLIWELGKKGQGPGEFIRPDVLRIHKNNIFVSDLGNNRISIFDSSGAFISSLNFPFRIRDFLVTSDDKIYIPSCHDKRLISAYNLAGEKTFSFGKLIDNSDLQMSRILSVAHVEKDENDNIYLAFIQSPFIRKYSSSGELIWEKNLMQYPELKKIFLMVEKRRKDKKYNIFTMCIGTDFKNRTFYVAYIGVIPFGNTVYCFSKEGVLKKILRISHGLIPIEKLPDAWDISMGHNGELWLAEWRNAQIIKFNKERN